MKYFKWKLFRRIVLALSVFGFVGSVVLLLNITAPNPTHRRYSSRGVVINADSNEIGQDAEKVLSDDLGVPNNNNRGQLVCCCNPTNQTDVPFGCNSCLPNPNQVASSNRPDFVTDAWIAESKSVQKMDVSLLSQISDYAQCALNTRRALWVYIRVNSYVDPRFYNLNYNGGGIVWYFAVPSYMDPVDSAAGDGLIGSVGVFAVFGAWEILARWRGMGGSRYGIPTRPGGPDYPPSLGIHTPVAHTTNPAGDVEDALHRAQDAARQTRDKLN